MRADRHRAIVPVGSQYRLKVADEEFRLDLLFYHLKLRDATDHRVEQTRHRLENQEQQLQAVEDAQAATALRQGSITSFVNGQSKEVTRTMRELADGQTQIRNQMQASVAQLQRELAELKRKMAAQAPSVFGNNTWALRLF